jgi:hypothetical protein
MTMRHLMTLVTMCALVLGGWTGERRSHYLSLAAKWEHGAAKIRDEVNFQESQPHLCGTDLLSRRRLIDCFLSQARLCREAARRPWSPPRGAN